MPRYFSSGKTPRPDTDMKYLSLETEADSINRHFANHSLVRVSASCLCDTDVDECLGDPDTQISVDIVAPRAFGQDAEWERHCALVAALVELESLPIVKSAKRIGDVYADDGMGEFYLVTIA